MPTIYECVSEYAGAVAWQRLTDEFYTATTAGGFRKLRAVSCDSDCMHMRQVFVIPSEFIVGSADLPLRIFEPPSAASCDVFRLESRVQ
jgi:hypothetical protein